MSMQDRMADDADWKDSINVFREQTSKRMLDLFRQINELELIVEEFANSKQSESEEG